MDDREEPHDLAHAIARDSLHNGHGHPTAPDPLIELICRGLQDYATMVEHVHADLLHMCHHLGIPAPECARPPRTS